MTFLVDFNKQYLLTKNLLHYMEKLEKKSNCYLILLSMKYKFKFSNNILTTLVLHFGIIRTLKWYKTMLHNTSFKNRIQQAILWCIFFFF